MRISDIGFFCGRGGICVPCGASYTATYLFGNFSRAVLYLYRDVFSEISAVFFFGRFENYEIP